METLTLSDPRNRNHKSLAIGNHIFEVASFFCRNRSKIAVSQKSHWAKKIAAIQNHTLVVATYSGGFADPCGASETLSKPHKTGSSRVQKVGFRGCFWSRSDFFELRLQSLAICDFEVTAIRVTKVSPHSSKTSISTNLPEATQHDWPESKVSDDC